MADWSQLPYDTIHKISTYITVIEDFLAFSAVCHPWRLVYLAKEWKSIPQVPMLMFSDYNNSRFRTIVSLYRNRVYNSELPEVLGRRCWGSSTEWLVTIGSHLKINLLNPFTRVSICLPSLPIYFSQMLDWHDIINKAFVFRNPFDLDANEEGLLVLIIAGPLYQLALCRPGYSSWRIVEEPYIVGFMDVTCLKNQIFALRKMGSLVVIDMESLAVVDINYQRHPQQDPLSVLPHWDWEQLFLVESCGELWIVLQEHNHRRSSINSIKFLIYSFDFVKKQWIRLKNLGNRTVFVGDNCSVATRSSDFLNCRSNCVYFVGTRNEERWPHRDAHVVLGVYIMAEGVSEALSFGTDAPKCYSFPRWVTPTLY